MNIQKVLLKVWRAIRDFVARCIDSSVARESKKASCAALRLNASKNAFIKSSKNAFIKSSKNASRKACGSCTSRALLSLLVASATLLATFVIAPTSALSAGENAGANTVSTENTGGTKSDSAKSEGEKQNPEQSESNNTELNKKNTGSSDALKNNNNKESKPVEKPKTAGNNGVDKAKSDSAVNKNVKDAQKKGVDSAAATNGTDRSTKGKPELPSECKSNMEEFGTFEKCYSITYYGTKNVKKTENKLDIKGNGNEPYNRVPQIITPTIKVAGKEQKTLPDGVWLELKKYGNDDSVNYAFFKGEDDSYTAKSTKNSDGSIRFFVSKWMAAKTYKFKFVIHYPDGSESKAKKIIAKLAKDDLPKAESGDLTINVNNFGSTDSTAQTGDSDKKSVSITIKPKSNSKGTDNKDTYDPIDNKLFIDSQSKYKPGFIYHRMICKTGTGDKASYTVDKVNGLSLNTQQFKHREGENRPDKNAENFALYESDPYTEESQSWISGTPTSAGTFECRVFAFKDAKLKRTLEGGKVTESSNLVKEFDARAETPEGKKSLFEGNIIEDKWKKDSPIQQGVDCDYKSVTIEVKSNKPPEPKPSEIGDNDLTLKVYPFKNSDGSLPAELPDKDNSISAILGMSLKPFVDATSAADSKNKITLRVLCSKGEKKKDNAAGGGASTDGAGLTTGSGSAVSGSNGANSGTSLNGGNTDAGSSSSAQSGSQTNKPSGSSQSAEDFEYKTWSSNLAELGLSVPADDNQNTCHSNKEGETTCKSSDPSKKVAARTDKEVSIKPTEVGDYQCVVFALKPKALETFDGLKGSLTPTSIKSSLTAAPASFKEHKDFAAFTFNIHSVSNFTLPHTGGQSWNLQLGILAALLVNLLAAGFVVSQSERGSKLILGRWRGLCNHV
ncbi:hypothetical protein ACJV45_06595 [Gardnerella sp. Marseille-Q9181]|uniref:hypothetical protein n=1 Tax=Gardnerella sp. Marseille-Q9181 TaxID=3383029 RepID=UPI003AF9E86A